MGLSWSNNRRRNYNYSAYTHHPHHHHHHHQPHYPPPYYYTDNPSVPPPPQNPQFAAPSYGVPPPAHAYCSHPVGYTSGVHGSSPVVGRPNGHPPGGGWPFGRPLPPPPYVEHQNAKKVRNVVNVHKDTVRIGVDQLNPDHHLVSFVFDALHDGSLTLIYFAKEESNCRFAPVVPDVYEPVKFFFQKGVGQRFSQPPGSGIDLGFFELDDLSKPSPEEDVFPLVISAETIDHVEGGSVPSHMQITQAVIEKNVLDDIFQVRVIKQILWVDGVRYELREIYGLGSSSADTDHRGKDCVICMTQPKDTAVLPCRHMCMCSECANELLVQSNKCPICRQPIEELIEIKINYGQGRIHY